MKKEKETTIRRKEFNDTTRNKKIWRLTKYFLIFVFNELGARRFQRRELLVI
jgi:hypothetical protein